MSKTHTSILDVQVSEVNYELALKNITDWIDSRKRSYICVANVHLVMECQKDRRLLKRVNNAGLVTPDGMPLVWLSKIYGKKKVGRVYGPTLTLKICQRAARNGYSIFLLGGKKDRSKQLRKALNEKFPSLSIVGAVDTPIRPIPSKKNAQIIEKINRSGADIVLVGEGCPHQELWMSKNREKLSANVLIGVGAAFDFITESVKQAPYWMQDAGLEWLFRLTQDPKRLFFRYTVLNSLFIIAIARQLFKDFVLKRDVAI